MRAAVAASSTIVIVDGRHVLGADDAERTDRQVVHLAGLGIDRERLGAAPSPTPCAPRRSRTTAARSRRADRPPRRAPRCDRAPGRRRSHVRPRSRPTARDAHVEQRGIVGERRRSTPAASSAPSTSTACSASPVGAQRRSRPADPRRRPRASARRPRTPYGVGHSRAGATPRATTPSISTRRRATTAVAAIGGRFGPSRTTSSREYTTRTGRPNRSASSRAARGARECTLPPNAPPLASGDAGSPPGSHHDASGSRYAGSTHDVASRTPPSGTAAAVEQRRPLLDGRAPALHLPRPRRALRATTSATTHCIPAASTRRPSNRAGAAPRRARHAARCRRRTARRRAARRRRRAARPAFELGAPRRGREISARRRCGTPRDRVVHRAPAGAPAEVRGERPIESRVAHAVAASAHDDARACRTRTAIRRSRRTTPRARRGLRRRVLRSS